MLIFANTLQKSRLYFAFRGLFSNCEPPHGQLPVKQTVPQTRKERRPISGATLVQFGHSLFNLVMRWFNGAIFALWAISAPLTLHFGPAGDCTLTPGELHIFPRELHNHRGEPQGTARQRRGTVEMRLGTAQRLPGRSRLLGINTPAILKSEAAESSTTAPPLEVLFIVQQRAYYEITIW